MALSQQYAMPVMLLAILLGLALHSLSTSEKLVPGIDWSAKTLLYIAVALLGLRVDLAIMIGAGVFLPLIVILLLIITLFLGYAFGRMFNLDKNFSILLAGAVAICGVSAAAAICCVLPKSKLRDGQLALTISGITALSTFAILVYPAITQYLELTEINAGIFLGGTIHNVSQAVGAGYSVSDQTGNITTIVKLLRVAALLPILICITLIFGRSENSDLRWKSYFPPFLIAFIALAAINYYNVLPTSIVDVGNQASEIFLIISLVAIGVKTDIKQLLSIGPKPLIVLTATTVFMAAATLILIFCLPY